MSSEAAAEFRAILEEFGGERPHSISNAVYGGAFHAPVIQTGSPGALHVHMPQPVPGDHIDLRGSTFNGPVTGVQHGRGEPPAAGHSGPAHWPSARNMKPVALGVRSTRRVKGLPVLPPYVARDQDDEVNSALRQAASDGGLVVVLGEPFAGKTRTALAAMAEVLPDFRVHAPPRHENLRGLPTLLRGAEERYGIWLDDLDGHLGSEGLEPRLLAQLTEQRVVVLATLREDAYDEYRHTSRGRVLELAHIVELPREWNTAERGRAETADDRRLTEAAGRSGAEGVAAYLAVGPLLWEEWQRARKADRHPRGHLLVRAAIDLARCGLRGPLSRELLVGAYETYKALPGAERESVDDALAWAAEKRHGVLRMLRPSGPTAWEASPYLVDVAAQDEGFPPVDLSVWNLALEAARTDSTYDMETVSSGTEAALRTVAEDGDSQAMHELGLLLESLGKGEEAERWFRRAAQAGHGESAGRLGRRLAERGEGREAEPFLEAAADGGDAGAATLLGNLLRARAQHWWEEGMALGDPEAAHQAGDLLLGSGDLDGAESCYLEAEASEHTEIARSVGMLLLLKNRRETAEVWLDRAAAAGDEQAIALLGNLRSRPQSLQGAERYFSTTDAYPMDHTHYGVVLEKRGRVDEARKQYEQGYAVGDAYAAHRLAALLRKQGNPEEARTWYRKAADMGHPGAKKALAAMKAPDPPATVDE
jgi:tetratricopeptide (TPR) repeat protein